MSVYDGMKGLVAWGITTAGLIKRRIHLFDKCTTIPFFQSVRPHSIKNTGIIQSYFVCECYFVCELCNVMLLLSNLQIMHASRTVKLWSTYRHRSSTAISILPGSPANRVFTIAQQAGYVKYSVVEGGRDGWEMLQCVCVLHKSKSQRSSPRMPPHSRCCSIY